MRVSKGFSYRYLFEDSNCKQDSTIQALTWQLEKFEVPYNAGLKRMLDTIFSYDISDRYMVALLKSYKQFLKNKKAHPLYLRKKKLKKENSNDRNSKRRAA